MKRGIVIFVVLMICLSIGAVEVAYARGLIPTDIDENFSNVQVTKDSKVDVRARPDGKDWGIEIEAIR